MALLLAELADAAAAGLAVSSTIRRRPQPSWRSSAMAADAHRRYGARRVPNYVISKTDGVSDMLEVALLLKEVGLLRPREGELDVNIIPLFETIDDLRIARRHGRAASAARVLACSTAAGRCRK